MRRGEKIFPLSVGKRRKEKRHRRREEKQVSSRSSCLSSCPLSSRDFARIPCLTCATSSMEGEVEINL